MKNLAAKLARLGLRFKPADGLQAEPFTRRKMVVICLLIFFTATGVRLLQWQNNRLTIDKTMWRLTERYKEEAQFLLDGELAAFVRGSTTGPDPGILMHTPGYAIVIAAIYQVSGSSDKALRLFHILADAVAALLIFLIAVELLPGTAAIIAGLLVAFSPQFAFNSLLLLPDSLSGVPILLAIYLLVRASKRPRLLTMMAAGAAIGISCWLRANALLLAPFLCLLILVLFERSRRWRYAAAFVGVAVLVIVPITIRNAIVFRSFIPLSLGAGQNLVAGIADYDPEGRFGMEAYDDAACRQEAELYNRPDYAADLYRPDGIERERARTARALSVIRSNKLWFLGVMARRAVFMIGYEQVPIVSVEPSVTNSLEITNETELAWSTSPADLLAGETVSRQAQLSLTDDNQSLRIAGTDSTAGRQLISALIKLQRNSDYVLRLPVKVEQGRMVIKVENAETGATLASAAVPDSLELKPSTNDSQAILQLPFVNTGADQVRIVFENAESRETPPPVMQIGGMEIFRLGSASYLWTRYPRALVKMVQKFFKTTWMLPLLLIGIALLSLARRGSVLAITLAVPAYYLCVHSPLHVEHRYVLAMHYFFSILIATSLYWFGKRFLQVARKLSALKLHSKPRSN